LERPAPVSSEDCRLAVELATAAGDVLLQLRSSDTSGDLNVLRHRGDAAAQDYLAGELARRVPEDAVLSEEGRDDHARLSASRVWIIDPLDGTREYAEQRDDWTVHVALWADGALRVGAVALPGLGITFGSCSPPPLTRLSARRPRVLVSRTRPPAESETVRAALGGELRPMGSAGAKAMGVLRGEGEVYLHSGGQYEWDSAAPATVAQAAGLHVSRLDGSPLVYNRADPWSPEFLVCRPELREQVLAALREAVEPSGVVRSADAEQSREPRGQGPGRPA
jgi:3'(2'), 5'-bisphosphate nucleotidase